MLSSYTLETLFISGIISAHQWHHSYIIFIYIRLRALFEKSNTSNMIFGAKPFHHTYHSGISLVWQHCRLNEFSKITSIILQMRNYISIAADEHAAKVTVTLRFYMSMCNTFVRQKHKPPQKSYSVADIQWHILDETMLGRNIREPFISPVTFIISLLPTINKMALWPIPSRPNS